MKVIADENIPFVEEVFGHFKEITTMPGREMNSSNIKDANILLVRSVTKVNKQLLKGSKVKFVATATIGLDHIDLPYLKKKGIGFASAPGSNATSVAEYIVSSLLNISKKHNFKLKNKSIGIIGVGNVGSRVQKRLEKLGLNVILNDPPLKNATSDNEKYKDLDDIYKCDIITVHTPLSKDSDYPTYHMINEDFLSKTKKGLIFINTSRGSVVDEKALHKYIENGHISSVVLDVWENEPAIDVNLLKKTDIGTPHIAGYSFDGKVRGTEMIYRAAIKYFNMESKWRLKLPKPDVPEIFINNIKRSDEECLREAVFAVYNVLDDGNRLNEIVKIAPDKKPDFFDTLRKNYPKRREFANTIVKLQKNKYSLKEKLQALEFIC